MHKFRFGYLLVFLIVSVSAFAQLNNNAPQVKTVNGILEGVNHSGVKIFKGVPFASPPVGQYRWREPQPVKNWEGVLKADKFGSRPMQKPVFSDMIFLSDKISEDCQI